MGFNSAFKGLTYVAVSRIMQLGGSQVEDPCSIVSFNESSIETTILRITIYTDVTPCLL